MADGVSISGMSSGTWFADSPVIIKVEGLSWPEKSGKLTSPFNVVRVEVFYDNKFCGQVKADTGGASSYEFDISSALRAVWADYGFSDEVSKANSAARGTGDNINRPSRNHALKAYLEYVSDGILQNVDKGTFGDNLFFSAVGGMTELERSLIANNGDKSVAHWASTNKRFGDASTKPTSSPEHVGKDSITSWVDITTGHTTGHYYAKTSKQETDQDTEHCPIVLRDSQPYVDFLFLNRRGAIETCSGLTKEAMDIGLETKQYGRVEGPSFKPSRSIMAIGSDGRRSWNMSSGYVTSDWAEWWAMEFLGGKRKRWWMLYKGSYVPVIVEPAKKSTTVYDRSKQNMPHVDFTVTLALEG